MNQAMESPSAGSSAPAASSVAGSSVASQSSVSAENKSPGNDWRKEVSRFAGSAFDTSKREARRVKDALDKGANAARKKGREVYKGCLDGDRQSIMIAGGTVGVTVLLLSKVLFGRGGKKESAKSQKQQRKTGQQVTAVVPTASASLAPLTDTLSPGDHLDARGHVQRALSRYVAAMKRDVGNDRALELLFQLPWMQACLRAGGLSTFLRMLMTVNNGDKNVALLMATLRRSAPALQLERSAEALPMQLLGRLGPEAAASLPEKLRLLVEECDKWRGTWTWMRPVVASLDSPGNGLDAVLEGHRDAVQAFALLPDSRIVSGSRDGTIRIWRDTECTCEVLLQGHEGPIKGVICIQSSLVVSGSTDGTIRVWNLRSSKCDRIIGAGKIVALAAAGGHRVVAATSDDFVLKVWNVTSGEMVQALAGHTDRVLALQLLPDGRIASGGVEGLVYLWRPSTGTRELALSTGGKVVGLASLPGAVIATAGLDSVKIWSTATGHCMQTIASGKVVCCAAQADGRLVTGHDAMWKVWSPFDGQCVRTNKGRRAASQAVLPLLDGRLATAAPDGCIRVWAAQGDSLLAAADQSHSDRVSCIACLPDGRVVSASWDSTLRIWNASKGVCEAVLKGHSSRVTVLVALSTRQILSSSTDSTRLWSARSGALAWVLTGHQRPVTGAVESAGRVVTSSEDGTLRSWLPATGAVENVFDGHLDKVTGVVAISDNRVVSCSADRTLRTWNVLTGKPIAVLRGHSEPVNCVAVLPNGLVMSGSDDRTLGVWNCERGMCELILKGHTDRVQSLVALGEGSVASVGSSNQMKVWNVESCLCEVSARATPGTVISLHDAVNRGRWFAFADGSFVLNNFGAAEFYVDDPVRALGLSVTPEEEIVLVVGTEQGGMHFLSVNTNSE